MRRAPRSAKTRSPDLREREIERALSSPRSVQNRDAAGQPVDVDVEFALAGGERDAAAVRSAVRIEADGADFLVDQVALSGEQLDPDLIGQLMDLRVGRDAKRARVDV